MFVDPFISLSYWPLDLFSSRLDVFLSARVEKTAEKGSKKQGSSQARSSWEHNPNNPLSAIWEQDQGIASAFLTTLTILSDHPTLLLVIDGPTYIIASPRSSLALTCKMMQHVECQPSNSAVTTWLELTNWSILCLMLVWLQSTLMCWLTEWCQWHKNIWICESPLLVGPPSFHVHWIQLPTVLNSRVNGLPCDIYCTTLMHLTIMFCQTVYPTPYAPPLAWGRLPRKDWSPVGQRFIEINE